MISRMKTQVKMESPEVSKAGVVPQKPSWDPYALYPDPQSPSELERDKPKSGIFINIQEIEEEEEEEGEGEQEEEPVVEKKKRRRRKSGKVKSEPVSPDDVETMLLEELRNYGEDGEDYNYYDEVNASTQITDDLKIRQIRKPVGSVASMATSVNEKELRLYEDTSWADIPVISKLVQTMRDEQSEKPKKKYVPGALENHSFTKLKQPTKDDFCFKSVIGTIHQGDDNFCKASRNRQGVCMPAAAFCYSKISNPKKWNINDIDEILELGNQLYLDSIKELHMHAGKQQLSDHEVQKFCIIKEKKIKFEIMNADINGLIRSMDKQIFNISRGFKIFFFMHNAGILKAKDFCILIWLKSNKYYVFDAAPRLKDLNQDPNGTALLAIVQDQIGLVSMILERSDLFNSPFSLSHIKLVKIMGADEPDVDVIDASSNYNMLTEKKAVVQGAFDLGDLCFAFTRNKQALCMSVVALTYSRITPPPSWHKKTIDKIMVIGNQLHSLCCDEEEVNDVELEHLPAMFTVGPYMFEVFIYANRYADTVFKKGNNRLQECLKEFFETNHSALVKIGKAYVAVWAQRDVFFMFDPYSRNKEGLKCRVGTACVSMNSDIETLVETIVTNFENRESVFYIHALKVLKIHRDPALAKLFPRHMMLHDVPLDRFKKSKVKKGKKKAVEQPITVNYTLHAMKKLLAGAPGPGESLTEIGSQMGSIGPEYLPTFVHNKYREIMAQKKCTDMAVADLDSPSLSDTQITPERPCATNCLFEEQVSLQDLDSFVLTMEEQELQLGEGDEGYRALGVREGYDEGESEMDDSYYAMTVLTQAHSTSLDPCVVSEQINTDLTYCYKLLPALELPKVNQLDHDPIINKDMQKTELERKLNFEDRVGGLQILHGKKTVLAFCDEMEVNLVAPYVCVMVTAYSLELPIQKWTKKTVDFVIKAGVDLYNEHNEKFNKIEEYEFHFERLDLFAKVEIIFNTYLGADIFDSSSGEKLLEEFLQTHIFTKSDCGYLVTPSYSCALLLKRCLYYLYDPYNNNTKGEGNGLDNEKGVPCLMRFKKLNDLTKRIILNKSKRENLNGPCNDFLMFTLARPVFTILGDKSVMGTQDKGEPHVPADDVKVTQSRELAKESNFVDLPDDSQIVSGTTEVGNFGAEVEFIAPFVCIMAAAVALKYSTRTWSAEVVDFVIKGGAELYKKSKFRYDQVAKLDIPKVSLGKTDFSISVEYLFDAPMKNSIVESALKRLLRKDGNWGVLVTQVYSCATYFRNELFYLFDAFPCNEVGLSEGPETDGFACIARFKNLRDMVTRIMYNKNKREEPEKLEYTRFILSICTAARIPPEPVKKHRRDSDPERNKVKVEKDDEEGEDGADAKPVKKARKDPDKKEDGDKQEKEPKNKIGFQPKAQYKIIEATKTLGTAGGASDELTEDHFICLVASLMAINKPIASWDTKRADKVFDIGKNIYAHADNLEVSKKRTIKNILIGAYFFDIIVKLLVIPDWKRNKNIDVGLNTIMRKRKFILIQFPNRAYVIHKDDEGCCLFSPYDWELPVKKKANEQDAKKTDDKQKNKNTNKNEKNKAKGDEKKEDEKESGKPGWVRFRNENDMKNYIKSNMADGCSSYAFYSFEVISVRKAAKSTIINNQLNEYEKMKPTKREVLGKPLHETASWVHMHQFPWSRMAEHTASGQPRDKEANKWNNWDVEFENDLYSLVGTLHQSDKRFEAKNRDKQTLANLVISIAMTHIYEFAEWNTAVVNAILYFGDRYFKECIEGINDANYELSMDDLKPNANISPYSFEVAFEPVVEGTMFLQHPKKFNLAKAMRYFFDNYESRCGVVLCQRKATKRLLSFGKIRDGEYFMFDCQSTGPPMFWERDGSAYLLRCSTLNRLVHIVSVTLGGGDFFIHEVETYNFKPAEKKEDDETDAEEKDDDDDEDADDADGDKKGKKGKWWDRRKKSQQDKKERKEKAKDEKKVKEEPEGDEPDEEEGG